MMKLNLNTIFIRVLISIFGIISIGVGAERVLDRYDIIKAKAIAQVDENGNIIISLSDVQNILNRVKSVDDAQKVILSKLSGLERKIDAIAKSMADLKNPVQANNNKPKAKNDKPKADPNKVYNIADAGSIVLGNPDAKVTVIKWTDFQ